MKNALEEMKELEVKQNKMKQKNPTTLRSPCEFGKDFAYGIDLTTTEETTTSKYSISLS